MKMPKLQLSTSVFKSKTVKANLSIGQMRKSLFHLLKQERNNGTMKLMTGRRMWIVITP